MARARPAVQAVFRAPVRLYDAGLGALLGRRFLCLTHVGRKSGQRHRTVLEVIAINRDEVTVIAGLGRSSDWFRNIEAGSPVSVEIGRARFPARHRVLESDEAVAVMADYERRNRLIRPIVYRLLTALTGRRYDGSAAARAELVSRLPLVAFRPVRPTG